jgi:hypothetical protein
LVGPKDLLAHLQRTFKLQFSINAQCHFASIFISKQPVEHLYFNSFMEVEPTDFMIQVQPMSFVDLLYLSFLMDQNFDFP